VPSGVHKNSAGIDPTGLNKLADDLEVDGIVAKGRDR